jgi:hypothetical protein
MAYSEDDINELYDLASGTCFYCEKRLSFHNYGAVGDVGAWEVDHFIPWLAEAQMTVDGVRCRRPGRAFRILWGNPWGFESLRSHHTPPHERDRARRSRAAGVLMLRTMPPIHHQ